jgi:hypothetical protein
MEKEKAREMVESLEVADVCIVVTGNNRKVTCVTDGPIDDVASLFLAAIAEFVNDLNSPKKIQHEDKQKICELLLKTCQATDNAHDLVALTYDAEAESVTALFESGGKRVINVAMDSGTAMIRDIMGNLGC